MRRAMVSVNNVNAGILEEIAEGKYLFTYLDNYHGAPISLTMPLANKIYEFDRFPAFFEGLLPEGIMLEALLRKYKIDSHDYFGQLIQIGENVAGAVTIEALK